jgi:serine protease Do
MRSTITLLLLFVMLSPTGCDMGRKSPPGGEDGGAAAPLAPMSPGAAAVTPGPIDVPPQVTGSLSFHEGFAPIVQRLSAAVVNVSSTRMVRAPSRGRDPFFSNPLFRDFFGEDGPSPGPRERREQSLGSGVIVSGDGHVLTNNHVIAGASKVRVALPDGRDFEARIVGADPKTDIAVLKIDGANLAFVPFGDSSKVRVGEFALAIGNPFGLGQTVTQGIISAVGRGNVGIVDYEDFIQTDAAINPGNSGGALVSAAGELIGINTAIIARGAQGNQGIGFAVPTEMARAVMDQILREGRVIRGWMGVGIQDVTPALREAMGLKETKGVVVSEVAPGSPAEKAGIARGDVLVELDGQPMTDSRSFRMQIAQNKPGTRVRIGLMRGGERREATVALGALPEEPQRPEERGGDALSDRLGIAVAPITPELRQRLDLPANARGVVIARVQSGGRAEAAGLRPGDVILEANRKPITGPDELKQALAQGGDGAVLFLVFRGGRTHYLVVEP